MYRFGAYGNGASLKQISTKFGFSEGSISNFTNRIILKLSKNSNKFIQWPNQFQRQEIGSFMASKLLPKCIGFVDGTDVPFATAPTKNKDVYWSRKKRYCMQVQIICDKNRRIIDLFTGYPGSVHDAKVYSFSPPGKYPSFFFSSGEYLIGDSAYGISETVVVPFRRSAAGLTRKQKAFNQHISGQRIAVEHCIGILKNRFCSLKDLRIQISPEGGHKQACEWILACAVLHNFLIDKDNWETIEEDADTDTSEAEEINSEEQQKRGILKRQALLEMYESFI